MKEYNRIIFVGQSGSSRAPMAAGILKEFTLNHPIEILARGMVVLFPEPINQKAEAVLISNGINPEGYTSVQLSGEVLTELVGDELEILNPYGGTLAAYGLCYETLRKSIKKLVKLLNEGE